MLGDAVEMGIAGGEFGSGIADTDDRAAVEMGGQARLFIQLRCMKAFLPAPPNQSLERNLRGESAMPVSLPCWDKNRVC